MAKGQVKQKQTPEILTKLEQAFAYDATIAEACFYAGISETTYYRWIEEKPELRERFEELRNTPVLKAREEWIKKFGEDWRACESYLKRKLKDEFSEKIETENRDVVEHKLDIDDIIERYEITKKLKQKRKGKPDIRATKD